MLAKTKLNALEIVISKPLIDSFISHDEFLGEYDEMKEEIENLKTSKFIEDFNLFRKQCYLIVWSVEKI